MKYPEADHGEWRRVVDHGVVADLNTHCVSRLPATPPAIQPAAAFTAGRVTLEHGGCAVRSPITHSNPFIPVVRRARLCG